MGAGRGYGPTHSQALEKLFCGVPHLTIIAPSHVHDPGLLLERAVVRDPGVFLFIEHKLLYSLGLIDVADDGGMPDHGDLPRVELRSESSGYPTAVLRNYDRGRPDVTLMAYGRLSRLCQIVLNQLAEEEVHVAAVFPAAVNRLPLDRLCDLARQSGRVVAVEDGTAGIGWSSEVSAQLTERLWWDLVRPARRVAAEPAIIPAARSLEDQVIVTAEKIRGAVVEVLSCAARRCE